MTTIEKRLRELGVTLPQPAAPVANYVPFVRSGALVYIAGQISSTPEGLIRGIVGADLNLEQGVAAARASAINLIAQMKAACEGDLHRVRRIVKLTGFVASTPEFTDHPKVINGASDLMVAVFGEAGRHARAAVGAPSLPRGAAVEIDAVVELV